MSVENVHVSDDDVKPTQSLPQPMGLVPLYPFPAIPSADLAKKPINFASSGLGFSFLPPIHQQAIHYATKTYFTDRQLNHEAESMLEEVIVEEALSLLEELIIEGVEPSDHALRRNAYQRKTKIDRLSKAIAYEIINDVLKEECHQSVIEFYDDLILSHRKNLNLKCFADDVLAKLELEIFQETAEDVLIGCLCGEACMSIVHDVLFDEVGTIAEEVLMHYGARLALSQYKQITKCAADVVLDSMSLQVLLPKPAAPAESTLAVIDHMMMDVLLSQFIQLESAPKDSCVPMQWYKKKVVLDVALDVVLDDLCRDLDKAGL